MCGEKIAPIGGNYSSFEVGMISVSFHVPAGTPAPEIEAMARQTYASLRGLGEEFREEKRVSFLRMLKHVKDDPREPGK